MMTVERFSWNDYQQACLRTAGTHENIDQAICAWSMGVAGESGELVDMLKKHVFHRKPCSPGAVASELGDVLYYLAMLAATFELKLEDIARGNVEKLAARYPDGFVFGGGRREE
jgi:NTP pyrophosphatase (non-canonical NTP hydrolase)